MHDFECTVQAREYSHGRGGAESTKESQPEEDPSVSARLQRLQNNYEDYGMRRTVEGVLVVHALKPITRGEVYDLILFYWGHG